MIRGKSPLSKGSEAASSYGKGDRKNRADRGHHRARKLSRGPSTLGTMGKASVSEKLSSVISGTDLENSEPDAAGAASVQSAIDSHRANISTKKGGLEGSGAEGMLSAQCEAAISRRSSYSSSGAPLPVKSGDTVVADFDGDAGIVRDDDGAKSLTSPNTLRASSMFASSNNSYGGCGSNRGRGSDCLTNGEQGPAGIEILPAPAAPSPVVVTATVVIPSQDQAEGTLHSNTVDVDANGTFKSEVAQILTGDSDGRVSVLCRFKCLQEEESLDSTRDWLRFSESASGEQAVSEQDTVNLRVGYSWSERAFDKVFRPGDGQEQVFAQVERVAHGVVEGFNGTVFAYGQTGSGKTYTMMGGLADARSFTDSPVRSSPDDRSEPKDHLDTLPEQQQPPSPPHTGKPDEPTEHAVAQAPITDSGKKGASPSGLGAEAGVIPRAVARVLRDAYARREQGWEFSLSATFVEIYNEKIRDLLEPSNDNLKVIENPGRGMEAAGATEVQISTLEEALEVLRAGARHRMTAPTLMHEASSRSHSIFMLRLEQHDAVRNCKVSARLTLVDLAGSERAGKAGLEGRHLEEASSINVSLHTLGRVIRKLSENAPHVPFRDSKLTRLLQESLGGNSRTVLVVCCSPEQVHFRETLSTLKFGECAKRVTTFVSANVVAAPDEVAAQLSELRGEVVRLKRQLHDLRLREARKNAALSRGRKKFRRASSIAAVRSLRGGVRVGEITYNSGEESSFGALSPSPAPRRSETALDSSISFGTARSSLSTRGFRSAQQSYSKTSPRHRPWWSEDECDLATATAYASAGAGDRTVWVSKLGVLRGGSTVRLMPHASGSAGMLGRLARRKVITPRNLVPELEHEGGHEKPPTMSSERSGGGNPQVGKLDKPVGISGDVEGGSWSCDPERQREQQPSDVGREGTSESTSRGPAEMGLVAATDARAAEEGTFVVAGSNAGLALNPVASAAEGEKDEGGDLPLILARLKQLEEGWTQKANAYEKLLQLKDLRIQSLESACLHGYLAGQHGSHSSSIPALKTSNKDAATGSPAPFSSVISTPSKRATGGIRARRTPPRGVAGNGKSPGARGNHAASKASPGESSKRSSVVTPPPPPPPPIWPTGRVHALDSDGNGC